MHFRVLLLNLLYISAVKHYLRFFMTVSSGTQDLPELIGFGTLDDVQFGSCDGSGRVEPEQEWFKKVFQEKPQHSQIYIHDCRILTYIISGYIESLNQQMNQTEGESSCLKAGLGNIGKKDFNIYVFF